MPVCGTANLAVQDVEMDGNRFELIMQCPDCGKINILLMIRKATIRK
jgi:hypothetical protein